MSHYTKELNTLKQLEIQYFEQRSAQQIFTKESLQLEKRIAILEYDLGVILYARLREVTIKMAIKYTNKSDIMLTHDVEMQSDLDEFDLVDMSANTIKLNHEKIEHIINRIESPLINKNKSLLTFLNQTITLIKLYKKAPFSDNNKINITSNYLIEALKISEKKELIDKQTYIVSKQYLLRVEYLKRELILIKSSDYKKIKSNPPTTHKDIINNIINGYTTLLRNIQKNEIQTPIKKINNRTFKAILQQENDLLIQKIENKLYGIKSVDSYNIVKEIKYIETKTSDKWFEEQEVITEKTYIHSTYKPLTETECDLVKIQIHFDETLKFFL